MSPSSRQAIAGTPTGSRPHGGVIQGPSTHAVTQPVPSVPSKFATVETCIESSVKHFLYITILILCHTIRDHGSILYLGMATEISNLPY